MKSSEQRAREFQDEMKAEFEERRNKEAPYGDLVEVLRIYPESFMFLWHGLVQRLKFEYEKLQRRFGRQSD